MLLRRLHEERKLLRDLMRGDLGLLDRVAGHLYVGRLHDASSAVLCHRHLVSYSVIT
jgi:hypothetical protein